MSKETNELASLAAEYYNELSLHGVPPEPAGRITASIVQTILASSLTKNLMDETVKGLDSIR